MSIEIEKRVSNGTEICSKEEKCLEELKTLIQGSSLEQLKKCIDEDDYLLRFVRGRKFDHIHAFQTLEYNYKIRHEKYPEIFSNLKPSLIRHVLDSGMMGVLKSRDKHGRKICFFRASHWNVNEASADDVMKATVLMAEELAPSKETQLNGIVLICDYNGFTWAHARHYSLHQMRMFINIFLYSYPTRFGSGYMLNAPMMWQVAYNLLKPFLPLKVKQRVHFSTKDGLKTLHENIPVDILPDWLGGKLCHENANDFELIESVIRKEEFYSNFNE